VSNQAKGGQFLDLRTGRVSNRQYKQPWFCESCDNVFLGGLERYGAAFCDRLQRSPYDTHAYDERLLPFLTSITWRSAKYDIEVLGRHKAEGRVMEAMRDWKGLLNCLRAPAPRVKPRYLPHSQHLFVVFAKGLELHLGLGGQVFEEDGLVFSQVGPLFIVGLLGRRRYSVPELSVWNTSQVSPDGGMVKPIKEWRAGGNVPLPLVRFLARHELRVITEIAGFVGRA
jgi:hypothetical protein